MFSFILVALLICSALIFPIISAFAVNSVTWDAYPDWKNQYRVRGYVQIFSYTGNTPTAYIYGQTNRGQSIDASVMEIGSVHSLYRDCDLNGLLPLLSYWGSACNQYGGN